MTHLFFVRHAHSQYTPDELSRPLSDQGFSDANKVTSLLQKEQIDIVASSPYKRAIQTVEGTALHFNKNIVLINDFRERLLSSEPLLDFNEAIHKVWQEVDFALTGGESNLAAQQRGVAATLYLLEQYAEKSIVIGTHGNIMTLIMQYFNSDYNFDFWQRLAMPDIYKLSFSGNSLINIKRIWMTNE